jgi:RHS repeat-associated protein
VEEFGGRKINYSYDLLNRLTKEAIIDPVNGNRTIEYTYDVVGNRISRNDSVEGVTTYAYDNNDRLLTETKAGITTSYVYDNNGNLVSEQSPTKTVVYDWDSENRLMGAITVDATGTHQVQYLYDENGIRVASIRDGMEVRYLVDENRQYAQVIEEYSSSTGAIASYVYGNELVSQTRGSTTSYYLKDEHSGVRLLTDAAGVVTDSYTYDAYGEVISRIGNTTNDYLYRGEQSDSSVGMQYLRARYYDQNTGRFVSTDPFEGVQENPASRHRYIYGNNSPITYVDPSGLLSQAETTATSVLLSILENLAITTGIQFATNLATRPIQGDIIWRGRMVGLEASLAVAIRSTVLRAYTLTEESTYAFGLLGVKQFFSGEWLQVSAGINLDDLLGGLAKGGAKNDELTIRSPRVWGANPGTLSGPVFTGSITAGLNTRTALQIGLGIGLFDDIYAGTEGAEFDAGISFYLGISIPFRGNLPPA